MQLRVLLRKKLARLTFGVVGVGSAGAVVAECLARIGVQQRSSTTTA